MNKRILVETTGRFALVTGLQIGTFFLTSNILTVSEFGYINILFAISFIMSNVATFGLPNSIVYFGHEMKYADSIKKIVYTHSIIIGIFVLMMILLSTAYFSSEYNVLIIYFFFQYLFLILNGFLQAKNSIRIMNVMNVIQWAIIFLILLYFALTDTKVSVSQVLITYTISYVISIVIFHRFIEINLSNVRRVTLIISKNEFYSYGLNTFINNIVSFLNHRLDLMVVGYFLGVGSAGYYSFASQVCEKMAIFSQAYCTILFPKLVRVNDKRERINIVLSQIVSLSLIITPVFIVFYFINSFIIEVFFNDKYTNSYEIIDILLWSVFIVSIERIVFTYLSSIGLVKINAKIGMATLIVNAFLTICFVSEYGVIGVAFATLLSSLISALLAYCYLRKVNE